MMTPEKKAKSFHTTMVLTQPKMLGIADSKVLSSFPYHYGSYATAKSRTQLENLLAFPYHYGSYATAKSRTQLENLLAFPYHYGSYATYINKHNLTMMKLVSIPLWFLRNVNGNGLLP